MSDVSRAFWPMALRERFGVPRFARRLGLRAQFLMAGGVVMVLAMFAVGQVVSVILTREAIHNTGAVTALMLNSFLAPLVQELSAATELEPSVIGRLNTLALDGEFRHRFPHLDIWRPDGTIAYSTSGNLIGKRFDLPQGAARALQSEVVAEYSDLTAGEHKARGLGTVYLEIYSPIREYHTGQVIGVAEIHETTSQLDEAVRDVRRKAWLTVLVVTIHLMAALFCIVHEASETISRQRGALKKVSRRNHELRMRVQRASSRATEFNERLLKNIGADLHDGPAQLIGSAVLKLEAIRQSPDASGREQAVNGVSRLLSEALNEVRQISRGLMLPSIEKLPLDEIVEQSICAHEFRTDTSVSRDIEIERIVPSHAVGICTYRFVQEGLANAIRHAKGNGQNVRAITAGRAFCIVVTDAGAPASEGASSADRDQRTGGMGLDGLRFRIESLGGTMRFERTSGGGSRLEMRLHVEGDAIDG